MSIVTRLRRNRALRALSTVDKCTCTCARIPISPLSSDHRQEVEVVVLLLSCCLYEYHGIVVFFIMSSGCWRTRTAHVAWRELDLPRPHGKLIRMIRSTK